MEIIYHHFKILSSTNDWAKAHLSSFSKEALTVIWADGQTGGRGQYGRRWISPMGLNLYATFVFFNLNFGLSSSYLEKFAPQILSFHDDVNGQGPFTSHERTRDASKLPKYEGEKPTTQVLRQNIDPLTCTHLLALSAQFLFPFSCQIKWPNDLLVHEKKIGGILCEKMASGETVVGIGINVNMPKDQLKMIDQPATSMLEETGKSFSIPSLVQTLAEQFSNDLSFYQPLLFQEKLKASMLGTTIRSG